MNSSNFIRTSPIKLFLLVCLLFGFASPGLVFAQTENPGSKFIKPLDTGITPVQIKIPPSATNLNLVEHPMLDASPLTWTRLVFQSFQDGNWEIYTASHEGANKFNLTSHPAADARPRLNRGATQVAFNSDRNGDSEIYTINNDGSGIKQITSSAASDYAPSWSPDNNFLVFVSDRDGNAEIYTINLVDMATSRFTFDPASDLFPMWSPDGTKIAWVRYSNNIGTIWVANADGSNPQAIYSEDYLQHPSWSPDSSRIAFDADIDGDLWNEIGVVNSSGAGLETLYDPDRQYCDVWMGSWSSDSLWIVYSIVTYMPDSDGNLIINTTDLEALRFEFYPERLSPGILPDWQLTDIQAPNSHVAPLPAYSRASGFFVNWQGEDIGPSGLNGYDIQYRSSNSSEWLDWQMNVLTDKALFSGSSGDTIYFRSHAGDDAGNVESWPMQSEGDTYTALYSWLISGLTMDNRSNPVANTTLAISPNALSSITSNPDGTFLGRLISTSSHNIQTSQTGYGEITSTDLDVKSDIDYSFVFPPQDNLVSNGGFEAGQFDNWTITGTLPISSSREAAHTGSHGAFLGIDCTGPCLNNSETISGDKIDFQIRPRIVTDSKNNVHALWSTYERVIYYSYRLHEGAWSTPQEVGNGGGWSSAMKLDMAIDSLDNLHVVWNGGTSPTSGHSYIYYAKKTASGNWSTPISIDEGLFSNIVADHQNNVYVLYGDWFNSLKYRKKTSTENWGAPMTLGPSNVWNESALSVGINNEIHFALQGEAGLSYRMLSTDGSLSPVYDLSAQGSVVQLATEVDSHGNLYIFWTSRFENVDTNYYAIKTVNGSWSVPASLPGITYAVSAKLDKQNNIHVFGSSAEVYECLYTRYKPNEGWLDPVHISDNFNSPCSLQVTFDQNNLMHLLKLTYSTLDYQTTPLVDQPADKLIQQTFTIPTDTHQATLSWMYKINGYSHLTSFLRVDISSDHATTQVFSNTASTIHSNWTHTWVDVSPWAGQTITLTFGAHQAANEPSVNVYLDDISLGSWLTPVISKVAPSSIDVIKSTEIVTITGSNFIETPTVKLNDIQLTEIEQLDEHTIQIYLPSDLPVGIYDVVVINPGGQTSILPNSLRIGKFIFLPLVRR